MFQTLSYMRQRYKVSKYFVIFFITNLPVLLWFILDAVSMLYSAVQMARYMLGDKIKNSGRKCSWSNRDMSRVCATSRKVAGSIPDYVTGIFHWHTPSGRTMALGLSQPLTEMSTRNNSWGGKGGWYVELTTLLHSCAGCHEIWGPQSPGNLWACPGL
jgi:hypothetical protein